jgi:hypothetical protein
VSVDSQRPHIEGHASAKRVYPGGKVTAVDYTTILARPRTARPSPFHLTLLSAAVGTMDMVLEPLRRALSKTHTPFSSLSLTIRFLGGRYRRAMLRSPLRCVHLPIWHSTRRIEDVFVQPDFVSHQQSAATSEHLPLMLSSALAKRPRCILLGAVGAGKTTVVQHLFLSAARGDQQTEGRIPVFISLSSLQLDETDICDVVRTSMQSVLGAALERRSS